MKQSKTSSHTYWFSPRELSNCIILCIFTPNLHDSVMLLLLSKSLGKVDTPKLECVLISFHFLSEIAYILRYFLVMYISLMLSSFFPRFCFPFCFFLLFFTFLVFPNDSSFNKPNPSRILSSPFSNLLW